MSQLIINDLNFCERELPEKQKIEGSASFFDFDLDFDFDAVFDNAGSAAAGWTFGYGLAIGDRIATVIAESFAIGIDAASSDGNG